MPEYNNEMTGVLFKNDKKTMPNHPDYKGSAEVEGRQYWVSAWIKTKRDGGEKFMSMAYTLKDNQPPVAASTVVAAEVPIATADFGGGVRDDFGADDDIPF